MKKNTKLKLEVKQLFGMYNYSLDFSQDINIIIGENGTGKSTILNILSYLKTNEINKIREIPFESIYIEVGEDKYTLSKEDFNPLHESIYPCFYEFIKSKYFSRGTNDEIVKKELSLFKLMYKDEIVMYDEMFKNIIESTFDFPPYSKKTISYKEVYEFANTLNLNNLDNKSFNFSKVYPVNAFKNSNFNDYKEFINNYLVEHLIVKSVSYASLILSNVFENEEFTEVIDVQSPSWYSDREVFIDKINKTYGITNEENASIKNMLGGMFNPNEYFQRDKNMDGKDICDILEELTTNFNPYDIHIEELKKYDREYLYFLIHQVSELHKREYGYLYENQDYEEYDYEAELIKSLSIMNYNYFHNSNDMDGTTMENDLRNCSLSISKNLDIIKIALSKTDVLLSVSNKYNKSFAKINNYLVNKKIIAGLNNSYIALTKDNKSIPLEKLSTGEKKIFNIFKNMQKNQGGVAIFDEPETSLSVYWIEQLLDDIIESTENKVIIATHSTDFIKEQHYKYLIPLLIDKEDE